MYTTYAEIVGEITGMLRDLKRVIVAIDGMACSGKSCLAGALASQFPHTCVIRMDDFYLPQSKRTAERMAQPGGHMDTVRFADEVAMPLWKAALPAYAPFDCHTQTFGETVNPAPDTELFIVEGTYALHPEIPDIYDLRIFVECDEDVRLRRLAEREGEGAAAFAAQWIARETLYFESYMTRELADMIYDGTDPDTTLETDTPAEEMADLLPYRKGENQDDHKT